MSQPSAAGGEPAFNAPWPSLVVPLVLVGAFVLQLRSLSEDVARFALSSQAILREGRFDVLFTSQFLHGGWAHLMMNAAFALALGAPVARLLGPGVRGAVVYFLFFLICGAIGGLGYVALHPGGSGLVVGASGAVSGLWGAASRLLWRRGRLGPIIDRQVLGMAAAMILLNVATGLLGGFVQMYIAWEAHVAGYIAGLLLIGPASVLAGRSRVRELP